MKLVTKAALVLLCLLSVADCKDVNDESSNKLMAQADEAIAKAQKQVDEEDDKSEDEKAKNQEDEEDDKSEDEKAKNQEDEQDDESEDEKAKNQEDKEDDKSEDEKAKSLVLSEEDDKSEDEKAKNQVDKEDDKSEDEKAKNQEDEEDDKSEDEKAKNQEDKEDDESEDERAKNQEDKEDDESEDEKAKNQEDKEDDKSEDEKAKNQVDEEDDKSEDEKAGEDQDDNEDDKTDDADLALVEAANKQPYSDANVDVFIRALQKVRRQKAAGRCGPSCLRVETLCRFKLVNIREQIKTHLRAQAVIIKSKLGVKIPEVAKPVSKVPAVVPGGIPVVPVVPVVKQPLQIVKPTLEARGGFREVMTRSQLAKLRR